MWRGSQNKSRLIHFVGTGDPKQGPSYLSWWKTLAILSRRPNPRSYGKSTSTNSARAGFGKDADGEVIREAPLAVWANLRQRALDTAIKEINAKTDLYVAIESIERAAHRRVTALIFAIKARMVSKGKPAG
jgi:hypothetical protein